MIRKVIDATAFAALIIVGCAWAATAWGQANNSNTWQTPGNQTVGGVVQMCPNTAGLAVPCATGTAGAAGLPPGATPVLASATGSTGAVTATLTGVAGKTTYICGFNVSAIGATTAATVAITVATLVGGVTQTYQNTVGITVASTVAQTFSPCLPASAIAGNIAVSEAADANGTAVDVNAWGYVQ